MNAKMKLLQNLFRQVSEEVLNFPLCHLCTTFLSPTSRVGLCLIQSNRLFMVRGLALLTL